MRKLAPAPTARCTATSKSSTTKSRCTGVQAAADLQRGGGRGEVDSLVQVIDIDVHEKIHHGRVLPKLHSSRTYSDRLVGCPRSSLTPRSEDDRLRLRMLRPPRSRACGPRGALPRQLGSESVGAARTRWSRRGVEPRGEKRAARGGCREPRTGDETVGSSRASRDVVFGRLRALGVHHARVRGSGGGELQR